MTTYSATKDDSGIGRLSRGGNSSCSYSAPAIGVTRSSALQKTSGGGCSKRRFARSTPSGTRRTPSFPGHGMSGSTLIVAINALLLKRTKLAGIRQPGKPGGLSKRGSVRHGSGTQGGGDTPRKDGKRFKSSEPADTPTLFSCFREPAAVRQGCGEALRRLPDALKSEDL